MQESPPSLNWTGPPIEVVSLGCGTMSQLTDAAKLAIENAEVVVGAQHHFDEIAHLKFGAEKILFPSPFSQLEETLSAWPDRSIVILASGDALFFGVGSALGKIVGHKNLLFHPNISSIQASFHRVGLGWDQAKVISLHGRPLSSLRRNLVNGRLLAILTDQQANPHSIAFELDEQGFGESAVWVCEAIGSKAEKVGKFLARELAECNAKFHSLNICIVQVVGTAKVLPSFPGIADHLFSTGAEPGFGMISKREVRLAILSLMQATDQETAWDIGAGCGSVSVEWARWNNTGTIYAIESDVQRITHIRANCERFGTTQNVKIIEGEATECCDVLPDPDCIFVGGSKGLSVMLDYSWSRLKPGGKLVASAVTETSAEALKQFFNNRENREWIELQVTKNLPDSHDKRTLSPVIIAKCTKPQ